jgi:hypothetical protein
MTARRCSRRQGRSGLRAWLRRSEFIVRRYGEQHFETLRQMHEPRRPQQRPLPNVPTSLPGGVESAAARAREAAEAAS